MDGKVIKDQKNITNAQKNFYINLYSEQLKSHDLNYIDLLNNFVNKCNVMWYLYNTKNCNILMHFKKTQQN